MRPRSIVVFDTTLRDGDQAPLAGFSLEEKIRIAEALAALRVDILEAGFPAASSADFEACRQIALRMGARRSAGETPRVAAMCRCRKEDIQRAGEALAGDPLGIIHLSLPVSDLHREAKLGLTRQELILKAREAVLFARGFASSVEMGAEDATRAEPEFLLEYCHAVSDAGASIVNIADTVGEATPDRITALVSLLITKVDDFASGKTRLSVHCHNDLGLAAANTLAGINAGAAQMELSIAGIGERGGNASLEEMLAILNNPLNAPGTTIHIDSSRLYETNRLVCGILGTGIPPFRPVWGSTAAAHASGIHQHGLSRNRYTYRSAHTTSSGFPDGRTVLSRHSGKAGVLSWLREYANIQTETLARDARDAITEEILAKLKSDGTDIVPGEILDILAGKGLYTGEVFHADGRLETTSISQGSTQHSFKAVYTQADRKFEAQGKSLIEVLYSLVKEMGGSVPHITAHSLTGGPEQYRAYLETRHPAKKDTILAHERTGKDGPRALFECLVDSANTSAAFTR